MDISTAILFSFDEMVCTLIDRDRETERPRDRERQRQRETERDKDKLSTKSNSLPEGWCLIY